MKPMIRLRTVLLAAAALLGTGVAAAQIVPPEGPHPAPGIETPMAGTRLHDDFSLSDLDAAFRAAGLGVTPKTAPNGLQYLEARNGGDLIFGAALACAGANQSQCQTLVLRSGRLDRSVSYEDMMRFSTGGHGADAVTFDAARRNPALMKVTHLHGRFDDNLLAGSVHDMTGDTQAFLQSLQGAAGQGFSAATPEGRVTGSFTGGNFAAGSLPLSPDAK